MGVDNEDDIFDRWRRAFNEADTVFIELLDHHLRHPVFVWMTITMIWASDTLTLIVFDNVDNINLGLIIWSYGNPSTIVEVGRIILTIIIPWIDHMVSLPHQPLLPSSWVEEEVLVNRTNLKHWMVERNLMDIIRGPGYPRCERRAGLPNSSWTLQCEDILMSW